MNCSSAVQLFPTAAMDHFRNFPAAEGRIGRLLQSNPGKSPEVRCEFPVGLEVKPRPRPQHNLCIIQNRI